MSLLKFELKKVFSSKFFLGMLVFAAALNLFTLYESNKNLQNEVSVGSFASYDEFLNSVELNAESSLSASVFNEGLSEFSRRNIEKTAEDFRKMQGVQIEEDKDTGVLILLNSKISDFCILLILVGLGLSLISDEKDKRLFHLLRSTKNGTFKTVSAKLLALFVCSFVSVFVITCGAAGYAACTFGFGDLLRSVQSVPEMLNCFLRLNIGEFLLMLFAVKTIGVFIVGTVVILCCLVCNRSITMLLSVGIIGGLSAALNFIPETAPFNHLKYLNFYSLINPYPVFKAYLNLNIFGQPVNVILVYAVFAFLTAAVVLAAVIIYYVKKRPLENSDKKSSRSVFKGRVHGSIAYFEFKKLLTLNKGAVIILLFALFQIYSVCNQVDYQSSEDYQYKYYMEMLEGKLTDEKEKFILNEKAKLDEAENKINLLNEQRRNGEISLQEFISQHEKYSDILNKSSVFNRVFDRYIYIKENPKAEFIYDAGYEKLFGISDKKFSLENSVMLLTVLAFCLCSVYSAEYKNETYRILVTTKYGTEKLRKTKIIVMLSISLMAFVTAYLPEIIYIGRFYGFNSLKSPLVSIPELSYLGALPVWSFILIMYLLRFAVTVMLLPVISLISRKSKNNILTAILFVILFVLPIALYGLGLDFMLKLSIYPLLSGLAFVGDTFLVSLVQWALLLVCCLISKIQVKSR